MSIDIIDFAGLQVSLTFEIAAYGQVANMWGFSVLTSAHIHTS